MKKTTIRIIVVAIIAPVLWIAGNLLYATLTDYKPKEIIEIPVKGEGSKELDSTLNLVIWNIGYAGLGEESDFFFDGGSTVRMDRETVRKNFYGIYNFITDNDSIDIFLLQEVDTDSRRSHHTNELEKLAESMPEYASSFCLNYKVDLVPVPYLEPMGRVRAGLANFSKFTPANSVRYQYPSSYDWPDRIYFLDRCCLLNRYELDNGKDLVVINTHNSAYDNGDMKAAEMAYLKTLVESEYEKGNYVIVGGDWNQSPPFFDADSFVQGSTDEITPHSSVPKDFLTNWGWIYDPAFPTNRSLKTAFNRETTPKQLIDFYLLSPNVEIQDCRTMAMHFQYSDHEPVYIRVRLR